MIEPERRNLGLRDRPDDPTEPRLPAKPERHRDESSDDDSGPSTEAPENPA
jgi:hypothetical protein